MKVFLAQAYTKQEYKGLIDRSIYILESFYYIRNSDDSFYSNNENFLLDSGAFTFMTNTKKTVNWEEYVLEYAEYIKKNNIKYFFELDIDSIVGLKEVERLRRLLENKTGRQCIPVWHKSRGLEYWKKMCQEYKYVAIGGIVAREISPKEYKYFPMLIDIAHKNNCKVHGLGFTALKSLHKYHFDTVDSSSYASGWRFGSMYQFKNNKLVSVNFKDKRVKDGRKLNIHNLNEWIKFQKYADKHL